MSKLQRLGELTRLLATAFPHTPAWIAGGAVRDALQDKAPKDVDVFFQHGVAARAEAERLVERGGRPWCLDFEVIETPNAYKLMTPYAGFMLDLVKVTAASPQATIDSFDFTMCAVALDREGNLTQHPLFRRDLERQQLRVLHMTSPLNTLRRVQKYVERGFKLPFEELVKIMDGLRSMDERAYRNEIAGLLACGGNPS